VIEIEAPEQTARCSGQHFGQHSQNFVVQKESLAWAADAEAATSDS
jgi:hypothetical protein